MTTTYPSHHEGAFVAAREVTNTYDTMARLNIIETKLGTAVRPTPGWQSVVSNVQFNAFGAVTILNHLGVAESRTYNELGQMTRLTKGTLLMLSTGVRSMSTCPLLFTHDLSASAYFL